MSHRDSLGYGELLPQDVVDIFAHEKQRGKKGHKKRSSSLGRALGWLKGRKKRKNLGANGRNPGLGPALDLALDGRAAGLQQGGHKGGHKSGKQASNHGNSHAVTKQHDDDKTPAPPLFQENVFIEASRPKYLEDLHSEALEGLKMMQQEETNNGVEYRDNESTISTMTVQTDGECGGFTTDSTIPDTSSVVSARSSVSTRSSRSGLTRQGSTFRPLSSGKKSDKAKTRRRHRKTIGGIPQHVQQEMGLDRVGWRLTSNVEEEQLMNGSETDGSTTDGPLDTPDSDINGPFTKYQIEQLLGTHAGHGSELLQHLGPEAVSPVTTANSPQLEVPGPVMSMSPQAAYMSKIIPNAVLPPSIDVVEINRGRSRNSVRTVSKSSLLLSSPAPSRASSRASSSRTTSSRGSKITSVSRQNTHNQSDSSCWSNSESSETLVSDSSTISSSSTARPKTSQDGDASAKEDRVSVISSHSKASRSTANGRLGSKVNEAKKEGTFVRSLSVMKPRRAPPPPSRSYSLHNKAKRRSRDLAELRIISGEPLHSASATGEENEKNKPGSSPRPLKINDSPGYNGDTSSLDDSTGSVSFSLLKSQPQQSGESAKVEEPAPKDTLEEKKEPLQENKLDKAISPSSGYSSQDCTSPPLAKQSHNSSPRHKRGILAKLQKLFPGSTAPSPHSESESQENTKATKGPESQPATAVDSADASPSVKALRELFNIPPPPKVHAPPAPPPEVWSHSKRSIELLLGPPAPGTTYAVVKKNPKDRRQQRPSPTLGERKQKSATIESMNEALQVKKVQESPLMGAESRHESNERLTENVELKGERKVTEKAEKTSASDILTGMLMKAVEKREERLAASRDGEPKKTAPDISLVRTSPCPSPLPGRHPAQPPSKAQATVSPESSWPPPPPPMVQAVADDVDFPLPPPPVFAEEEVKTMGPAPGSAPPPLVIPPPPSYTAPQPPLPVCLSPITEEAGPLSEEASPPKVKYVAPPPAKEASPPPPVEVSPPPPPPPPPTKEVAPLPKEVPPPPPKEDSPAPPPPPKEVLLLPKEVPPPPPKEDSPAPPPPAKEVLLLPKEVPPPPLKEDSPPPPPPPQEVLLLPKEVPPPPPKEDSAPAPPPPPEEPPLPPKEDSPPTSVVSEESSPPSIQVLPPVVQDASSILVPAPPAEGAPPPLVIEVPVLKEVCKSSEEAALPSSQEEASQPSEEEPPVSKLCPPESVPPPPPTVAPPQSSEQESDLQQQSVLAESEDNPAPSNSILTPPQSIPPPPPLELVPSSQDTPSNTDGEAAQEAPDETPIPSAPGIIPEKPQETVPCVPENVPPPSGTENQSPEPPSAPVVVEDPTPVVTPSLLQMVKLRSVNNSPEPPAKAEEQSEPEVTTSPQQPSDPVPVPPTSSEAPQKPIRRSLILTSPPPTSPPATVTPPSQPLVLPPASTSTTLSPSPTKKSPPAMTASPSMNLQEAIRLRTAARSKDGGASRLSLHSPTSPMDLRKSPSSTASFIFSKSTMKMAVEAKAAAQGDPAAHPKAVKMPPPVAKKPKAKAKEAEQTAGQEAKPEGAADMSENANGTVAGSAEEGQT